MVQPGPRDEPSMVTPIVRRHLVELFVERYTSGNMTAEVLILRGLRPNWKHVYEGRGRVHRLAASVQMGFGDEPQYMVSGTVSVPILDRYGQPVAPQVNDSIFVLRHHDPDTAGRMFRVMHVDHAGQFNGVVSMNVLGAEDSTTSMDPELNLRRVPETNHDYEMDAPFKRLEVTDG